MPLDGLYPSFVKIMYRSVFGTHVQTMPTRQWLGTAGTPGTYEAWDGSVVNADTMIEAFITESLLNNLPSTEFYAYEIYDVPVVDKPPVWKYARYISGNVGVLTNTGVAKAVSYTISLKCADGSGLRIVNLDTPVQNFFGNIVGTSARDNGMITEILNPANAWQGRRGAQPIAFSNITVSLNKRLRRKYGMI